MEDYQASLSEFFYHCTMYIEAEESGYQSNYNQSLQTFFEMLAFKNTTYNQIKIQADKKLSSDFNVMEFLQLDELMLSKLLAFLLDPNATHGQGKKFLEAFLMHLKFNIANPITRERVRVYTEYPTHHGRFIDIVIKIGEDLIIGIENKPYTGELSNQVSDYVDFLQQKTTQNGFTDFGFVFLQATGEKPLSIDQEKRDRLEKKGKLMVLSYSVDMIDLLADYSRICESDKFRFFLHDFKDIIIRKFGGGYNGKV